MSAASTREVAALVFVTVGSQKFQFDRLLRAVDECVGNGSIQDEVFAQTGASAYVPKHFKSAPFLDRDEFARRMDAASVIVTHGGTGAIVGALKRGKRVIAMARLACLGEHVDNHQVQLLREFEETGLIATCEDGQSLAQAYSARLGIAPVRYRSTNEKFVADLDRFLEKCLRS